MAQVQGKWFGKSTKYKHVSKKSGTSGLITFVGYVLGSRKQDFKTEREAAIWVDKMLISKGKDPVNILKRK